MEGQRSAEKTLEEVGGDELPCYEHIVERFGLYHAPDCNPEVAPSSGIVSCVCASCHQWHAYVAGSGAFSSFPQYEIFTREGVGALGDYLIERAAFYNLPLLHVLEVGAGDGRLCFHLRKYLDSYQKQYQGSSKIVITPTDIGVRNPELCMAVVEVAEAKQAIQTYEADVVIACWMPMGVDWSAAMRASPTTREYLLIGETEDGICGDRVLTWQWHRDEDDDVESESDASHSSIDICVTSNVNSDGVLNVKTRDNTSEFRRSNRDAFRHDSIQGLIDKPNREILGSDIDDSSSEEVSETPSRHVDSVKGNSRFYSSVVGSKWERVELWVSEGKQIGRTDERWSSRHHSHTVSFRRIVD